MRAVPPSSGRASPGKAAAPSLAGREGHPPEHRHGRGFKIRCGGHASPQRLGSHPRTGSHQAASRTRRSRGRSRHQHLRRAAVMTALRHSPRVGDRPPTLGHTSPLASGWQRRVGDEATGFVAMCFKEVEPVTLRSGTRRSPFPTRTPVSARLHRGRALAKRGWDKRGPPTRGCLAENSNLA